MDPDPTPDPTPFFRDFKDAKKIIFSPYYFLITYQLSSVLKIKFFAKLLKILFCKHYFRKGKDPEPEPYL